MGSVLMTSEEACEFLKRSDRTVRSYVGQGLIRTERRGLRLYYMREDVEQVKLSLGKGMPLANRKTLWAVLKRLEAQDIRINELEEKLLGHKMLRPMKADAEALVDHARWTLSLPEWPLELIQHWANTFMQFDHVTLEKIEEDCNLPRPWELFSQVASKLLVVLDNHHATAGDLGLQSLRHQIARAVDRFKGFMVLWFETGKVAPPPGLERKETPKEKLLREAKERKAVQDSNS